MTALKLIFPVASSNQADMLWSLTHCMGVQVTKTPNAESPLVHGETPLLTMDVWEHACRAPHYR